MPDLPDATTMLRLHALEQALAELTARLDALAAHVSEIASGDHAHDQYAPYEGYEVLESRIERLDARLQREHRDLKRDIDDVEAVARRRAP